jgi:hypothetical protein
MRLSGWIFAVAVLPGIPLALGCSKKYPAKVGEVRDPPNTPCEQSQQCRRFGWCGEQNGECVATADAQCRSSELCRKSGLCSLEGRQCVAKGGDCSSSEWCDKFKLCKAHEGVCK